VTNDSADEQHAARCQQRCAEAQDCQRVTGANRFGEERERSRQQRESRRLQKVEVAVGERTVDEPDR
jgi:hypothetical protein